MANVYKVMHSDMVSVADAIRLKGETTEQLVFPGGFVTAINDIRTGVELNFQVVGGTAAPANPTENTIWVNTDQTITSWVFSHNQPSNPSEGMVWIINGVSGVHEFDATSDVSLRVQVASVKQYVSGAWVVKTTKVYQNGAWIPTFMYLFKNGIGAILPLTLGKQANGTASMNNEYISLSYTTTNNGQSLVQSTNPINLSNFSKLKAEILCTNNISDSKYNGRIGIYNRSIPNGQLGETSAAGMLRIPVNSARTVYSLTISDSLKDAFYIAIGGVTAMKIYNIWLE